MGSRTHASLDFKLYFQSLEHIKKNLHFFEYLNPKIGHARRLEGKKKKLSFKSLCPLNDLISVMANS